MKDEIEFTLKSTLTEEQIDLITDAEFEHTDRIWFNTPNGKHIEFVKAQQWIPCSERLPAIGQPVLRTIKEAGWNGKEYLIVDIGVYNTNDGSIVAWMPLPEPYKAESEDKNESI